MEKQKCAKCGRSFMIDKDTPLKLFTLNISTAKRSKKEVALLQKLARPYKVNTDYKVCPRCVLDAYLK